MARFFIRLAVFFGTAALGLLGASLLLPGFSLSMPGLITAVLVFAILQAVLAPVVSKLAERYAPAISGGVGVISTFVALVVANFTGGLKIVGISTWLLAALVVWVITTASGWVLETLFMKQSLEEKR